jgi:hypothetical protein
LSIVPILFGSKFPFKKIANDRPILDQWKFFLIG